MGSSNSQVLRHTQDDRPSPTSDASAKWTKFPSSPVIGLKIESLHRTCLVVALFSLIGEEDDFNADLVTTRMIRVFFGMSEATMDDVFEASLRGRQGAACWLSAVDSDDEDM